jgi:LAS superfamily LD-carboxypeptidase LdcB
MPPRTSFLSAYGVHAVLVIIIIGGSVYAYTQNKKYTELKAKTDTQIQLLASTTASLSQSVKFIQDVLSANKSFNDTLTATLLAQQQTAASLQGDLLRVSGTVGTLDKLSKTDKELLQKYSKVYFLNEHYVPSALSEIDKKYLLPKDTRVLKIHTDVLPHLARLLDDARSLNTVISVDSAYRSFYDQAHLKSTYSVIYGAGTANQFSADQGYSGRPLT